jgi:hypothetical protein
MIGYLSLANPAVICLYSKEREREREREREELENHPGVKK